MGIVQFSEGVRDPDRLVSTTWASLRLSLAVGGLAAAVLVILAHPLLSLLGERYAESSAGALRWLAAGLVPYAVLQAYNAVCRAHGRYTEAIVVGVILGVALCATALWLADKGASAMALGWLVVLSVGAAGVGLRLVLVLRRVGRGAR
jgi:Na+-driven multidrug efflux pump